MKNKILVGALELCNLPEFEINKLHIRVDTGAKTSSLHVDNIEYFSVNNEDWVRFDIHPDIHDVNTVVTKESKIIDIKKIKSSNGDVQKRPIISTMFEIGDRKWPINITLSDRSSMTYLMLLGRQAMNGHIIVDPEFDYLLGK